MDAAHAFGAASVEAPFSTLATECRAPGPPDAWSHRTGQAGCARSRTAETPSRHRAHGCHSRLVNQAAPRRARVRGDGTRRVSPDARRALLRDVSAFPRRRGRPGMALATTRRGRLGRGGARRLGAGCWASRGCSWRVRQTPDRGGTGRAPHPGGSEGTPRSRPRGRDSHSRHVSRPVAHMVACQWLANANLAGPHTRLFWTPTFEDAQRTLGARRCRHCRWPHG